MKNNGIRIEVKTLKKIDKRITELNQKLKKRLREHEGIKDSYDKLELEINLCNKSVLKKIVKITIKWGLKFFNMEYYLSILKKEIQYKHIKLHKESVEKKMKNIEEELSYLLGQKSQKKEYVISDVFYSEELRDKIKGYNKSIEKIKITVSEHGLLRYLERIKGIDIEQVKKEMIPKELLEFSEQEIKELNFEKQGIKYIVKGNNIVTVIKKKEKKKKYEVIEIEKVITILDFIYIKL